MTDEMLRWQTRRFEELAVRQVEDAPLGPPLGGAAARWGSGLVEVRPEQVVEVAFNDVQHSSEYSSGAALRFARVRRYRMDKSAADANTLEEVRALLPKL
jgi:DNA ligase-1